MRWRHVLVAACIVTGAAHPALADGFDARPVTIEAQGGIGSVILSNPGDRRIYLETVVYDWSQDAAGHDVLTESEEAVASPPAMWIGPHTTYKLRLRLPNGAPGQERAFRVMIRQLPDRNDIIAGRIVFALTQSLPAFVEPEAIQPPALRGQLAGGRTLVISNDGGRRARLANLSQDGHMVMPGLAGYALQHASLSIALPASVHPGALEVDTDLGRRTLDVR
nr:fimbria/pilus periplasmic chaperone [uncultured Lichenicoccus sp.]